MYPCLPCEKSFGNEVTFVLHMRFKHDLLTEPQLEKIKPPCSTVKQEPKQSTNSGKVSTCLVCVYEKPNALIYPCGHLHYCLACAKKVNNNRCPTCRSEILDIVQVFN